MDRQDTFNLLNHILIIMLASITGTVTMYYNGNYTDKYQILFIISFYTSSILLLIYVFLWYKYLSSKKEK